MKKITIILVTFLILFMVFSNFTIVKADSLWEKIQSQANDFKNHGEEKGEGDPDITPTQISDIALPIFQFMITIATIVVTIVTVIMGIKYITANPEGKAKLKQQLIGLVVSIIVIWGAYGIWAFMANFLEDITK